MSADERVSAQCGGAEDAPPVAPPQDGGTDAGGALRIADAVVDAPTGEFRYADVVVDAPTGKPGDVFTYAVPQGMDVRPGHLVRIPFGRRTLHGIVTGLRETPNVDYTREVASLVDERPLISPERVELARWIADYYRTSAFEALALMLPPGMRGGAQRYLQAADDAPPGAEERLSKGARKLLAHLRANPVRHRMAALAASLGPWTANAARALIEAKLAIEWISEPEPKPPSSRKRSAPKSGAAGKPLLVPAASASDLRDRARERPRAPRQAALLRELARAPAGLGAADARKKFGQPVVAKIVEEGLAALAANPPANPVPLLPTPAQQAALAALKLAMDDPSVEPRVYLLRGATGSGKTEVYLQAVAHCLEQGRRALVLVPEIALTPQIAQRFEERFPGKAGLLHGRMTPAQAGAEWRRALDGERGVIIGPRSALFAPMDNLGLIVLDEEHEWTYKQEDPNPRYHARAAAERLAEIAGAVVALGSATPDVVTAWRAERGAVGKLELPSRIERSGAPTDLAQVSVVDMRDELREGNSSVFSRLLRERLEETLADGRQAILFLNRRGAASAVVCRNCGHAMRCARCSASLAYHEPPDGKGAARLRCHHCGGARGAPARCPKCRSARIRYLGLGAQRLVDEVRRVAPDARTLRWDSDAISDARAHERLLRAFAAREADVLVGTQMVAKGLDVPAVDLVGVVLADIGLHAPDFRAPERTFQLLTQVAGRAGRGARPGFAVIQTYAPEHYAIETAAAQDYEAFYAEEMERRRELQNPPFSKLVRLLIAHSDNRTAMREAERLAGLLRRTAREWGMSGADVIGPAPSYPPRLRNAWRWSIVVRAPEPRMLLDKISVPPAWRVDVDPVHVA